METKEGEGEEYVYDPKDYSLKVDFAKSARSAVRCVLFSK